MHFHGQHFNQFKFRAMFNSLQVLHLKESTLFVCGLKQVMKDMPWKTIFFLTLLVGD
jgi:hypothetical protein